MLLNLHDLVLDRQADILDLIQWESGKSRKHAFEEVALRRDGGPLLRRARRRAISRTTPQVGHLPGPHPGRRSTGSPKGVVGMISPWNYPFSMAIGDGLAALMAGNAVLHKPDLQTPLSTLYGVDLLVEAGMPRRPVAGRVRTGPGHRAAS